MNNENLPAYKDMAALPAEVTSADWGAIEDMETTDLLIPKIFHQQAMSKFVSDGVARAGDFCDSITGEVLAKKENALQIIIFGSYKTMIVSKQLGSTDKYKLDKIITITPENAKDWAAKPFTEMTPEGMVKYSLHYNYYCLLPHKIKEMPYVLTLGSTKVKAARKLNTMLYRISTMKRPGASVVFALNSVEEQNDQGKWFGLEISQTRNSEPEELFRAHAWHVKSKSQTFKVVEDEAASDSESRVDEDDSGPF